jgi:putative ABC transport system permease protein
MSVLTKDHIAFIIRDLHRRGVFLEGFQDEVIDHICSAVEKEMQDGKNFKEAYDGVVGAFGNGRGLQKTQAQVIRAQNSNRLSMFKNYFVVAIRTHIRQRFYTLINMTGLAVGLAACLTIALYVAHELSYDRHYSDAARIFRVDQELKFGTNHIIVSQAPASLAELLQHDYPEIEKSVRVIYWGSRHFKLPESTETFSEKYIGWADSTFFEIFPQTSIEGDLRSAVSNPGMVAISRSVAQKYFPGGSAIGKTIIIDESWNHMVTAVYEDMPENSHMRFDMIMATSELKYEKDRSLLGGSDMTTYIRLREGVNAAALEDKLDAFVDKYVAPQFVQVMGPDFTMEKFRAAGEKWDYSLMPLTDIHLNSHKLGEFRDNGNIAYVYLLSAIGFFILCIACINFMNLSTARSSLRAKEVGVRKTMGSLRSHLVKQFLIESLTLCFLAVIASVLVTVLMLPTFNDLSQKNLSIPFDDPYFYGLLIVATIVIGALAGLYPSLFLSAFKPANALKGMGASGMKSSGIRSSLVVFQFVISILLIIGTLSVNLQIRYMRGKSLGFQQDQVIVVKDAGSLRDRARDFKNKVVEHAAISSGTISGFLPVEGYWRSNDTMWQEGKEVTADNLKDMVSVQVWDVDADYIKTLGMKLVAGRDFSEQLASDSTAVIVNQAAARRFEYLEPVGRKIHDFGPPKSDGTPNLKSITTWTIIGVVEDFHFQSMKQSIRPVVLFFKPSQGSVAFKYDAARTEEVIELLEKNWKERVSDRPFQYSFLDEDFARTFRAEERLSQIFGSFAVLAIMIACLGLFALTAFISEMRLKEIGIRKVLGASVHNIIVLLSRDLGKLVLIAFALSIPVAWLGVKWWIESYEYRTSIGVWVYAVAGLTVLAIAWVTMSFQSIKAAMGNPVEALRSE